MELLGLVRAVDIMDSFKRDILKCQFSPECAVSVCVPFVSSQGPSQSALTQDIKSLQDRVKVLEVSKAMCIHGGTHYNDTFNTQSTVQKLKTKVKSQEKEIEDLKSAQNQNDDLPGVLSHTDCADELLSPPPPGTQTAVPTAKSELGMPRTADSEEVSSLEKTWHVQKFRWSHLQNLLHYS